MLVALTILTGVIYPVIVTAVAQTVFPEQARGSLMRRGEQVVGSALIGQPFSRPVYFWGRLSATAPTPYNAAASSGSNYGPLHPALTATAEQRIAALRSAGSVGSSIPVDLITASASGLDPHISPAAVEFQVSRVAAARGLPVDEVRALVQEHTESRHFGVLGEPRVNVLRLNLSLDDVARK